MRRGLLSPNAGGPLIKACDRCITVNTDKKFSVGCDANAQGMPAQPCLRQIRPHPREVIQTPTIVTPSPTNIAAVRGSANSAQAQSMVTGGLR
jgi:hypothetical protein